MRYIDATRLFLLSIFLGFIPSGTLLANDSLYHFDFTRLPNRGISCADQAAEIASRFKQAMGIALARAQCTRDTGTEYDITLYYSAPLSVSIVSTLEYSGGAPSSYQGAFVTPELCEATLAAQVALFRAHTGLTPITAYCFRESYVDQPYAVRIDAFGQARLFPSIWTRELWGTPKGDVPALNARLAAYARTKLPSLASVDFLRGGIGGYSVRTSFYGNEKSPTVTFDQIGAFAANGSCERAQAIAENRLQAISPAPPVFCVRDKHSYGDNLYLYQVKSGAYVELVTYPRAYSGMGDCELDEAAALKDVTSSLGVPAIGGICVGDAKNAGMQVLLRKP